jgi:hypothetical protein
MRDLDFRPATALLTEFRQPDIERGPRGEAIMMFMVTIASDMTAELGKPFLVTDFMKSLFGKPSIDPEVDDFMQALPSAIHPKVRSKYRASPFNKTFANSKMYFNHFVQVADYQVVSRDYLWRMILRGAAVICANNRAGVDFIIPFCYSDEKLGRSSVGGMFWQIKTDARFGALPHPHLFDTMDPYKLGTYNEQDEDAVTGGLPIIRVVATLASKVPLLRNFLYNDTRNFKVKDEPKQAEQRPRRRATAAPHAEMNSKKLMEAVVPQKHQRPYTTYDFYCGGLNPTIWRPMFQAGAVFDWEGLLDRSGTWDHIFESDHSGDIQKSIRRSQVPGASTNPAHWSGFSSFEKMAETEEEDVNAPER